MGMMGSTGMQGQNPIGASGMHVQNQMMGLAGNPAAAQWQQSQSSSAQPCHSPRASSFNPTNPFSASAQQGAQAASDLAHGPAQNPSQQWGPGSGPVTSMGPAQQWGQIAGSQG